MEVGVAAIPQDPEAFQLVVRVVDNPVDTYTFTAALDEIGLTHLRDQAADLLASKPATIVRPTLVIPG